LSTVVAVMDRDSWEANTDVIVVVDPVARRLIWVPRDLWCERVGDRINAAYRRGGHSLLAEGLAELRLRVDAGICVRRAFSERVLSGAAVTVPVRRRLRFWYPLEPCARIQDGRRLITFEPPAETLVGERLHQWVGARSSPDSTAGDFGRIVRQQILVRRWLEARIAVEVGAPAEWLDVTAQRAVDDLRLIDASWRFDVLDDTRNAVIDGKDVLLPRRSPVWIHRLRRMTRRWLDPLRRP
jgi:hypothetical protein